MAKPKSVPTELQKRFEAAKTQADTARENANKNPNKADLKAHADKLAATAKDLGTQVRAENFIKLGKLRGKKARDAILNVGKLATKSYSFNGDQVKKILGQLSAAVTTIETAFEAALAGKETAAPADDFEL